MMTMCARVCVRWAASLLSNDAFDLFGFHLFFKQILFPLCFHIN